MDKSGVLKNIKTTLNEHRSEIIMSCAAIYIACCLNKIVGTVYSIGDSMNNVASVVNRNSDVLSGALRVDLYQVFHKKTGGLV